MERWSGEVSLWARTHPFEVTTLRNGVFFGRKKGHTSTSACERKLLERGGHSERGNKKVRVDGK